MLELRERGVAALLNSHLIGEVERVCDRVVILDKGRAAAAGTLDELLGRRELRLGVRPAWARRPTPGWRRPVGEPRRKRLTIVIDDPDRVPGLIADLARSACACTPSSRRGSASKNGSSHPPRSHDDQTVPIVAGLTVREASADEWCGRWLAMTLGPDGAQRVGVPRASTPSSARSPAARRCS